jgi:hypothetical protein
VGGIVGKSVQKEQNEKMMLVAEKSFYSKWKSRITVTQSNIA